MKNDPPICTTAKAIEYLRKILDTSQYKKIHKLTNNIIMTSQISSLNKAIKMHLD